MRKLIINLSILCISVTLFSFCILSSNELTGLWNFNIKGVPEGYSNGTIEFIEKDGALTGTMVTDNGNFAMENLKTSSDTITYDLTVSSHILQATLIKVKDSLSGTISTPQGDLIISGKRK
ncbi:MAG: hypothetical protein EOO85_01390 [Pedobacter sp.]|nr:MAG: hypothetical protein EOO85_01390 [Pedobacter sp.]